MTKCEKCRERAATVFIKRVVDAQSSHAQLCEECAREEAIATAWLSGAPVPPNAAEMPLEELLMELLTNAPDPDSFAPEDDKWSLQKLAAYDALQSHGEFPADEDMADELDEMDSGMDSDDEDNALLSDLDLELREDAEISPEELQAALDEMEPEEREAMSQMLEALDEVQQQLESIIHEHAEAESEEAEDTDDALATLRALAKMDASQSDLFEPEPPASKDEDLETEAAPAFQSTPSQRCPKCRTTWDRLHQDGRAGCASCYEAFAEQVAAMMERQQRPSQHIGKAPRAAAKRRKRLETLRARRDSRLASLHSKLQEALRADNFEEAAKLRDKIKIIESTIVDSA